MAKSKIENLSPKRPSPQFISFILQNIKPVLLILLSLAILTYSYLLYSSSASAPQVHSLINTDLPTLKKIFSATPLSSSSPPYPPPIFIHYCYDFGNKEHLPLKLSQAHQLIGSKYQVTILNCSQVLPNNQTIAQRFKLNSKWKPMIFTTVPWAKPSQIPPLSLKESQQMANFILSATQPKPFSARNTKDFLQNCRFNSSSGSPASSSLCLVVMKGHRYSESQEGTLTKMVEKYHKYHVSLIDANERRLSFEKTLPPSASLNPQNYALRVYMIGDGTHYLAMKDSPTWENIQTFVDKAIETPLTNFETAEPNDITLVKPSLSSYSAPTSSSPSSKKKRRKEAQSEEKNEPVAEAEEGVSSTKDEQQSGESLDQFQQRREQQRREQMERESREYLFENDEDDEDEDDSEEIKSERQSQQEEAEEREREDCDLDSEGEESEDEDEVIEL